MENGAEECNAIVNMAPATTTTIASPACSGRCLSNNSSGRGFSSLSRMGSGKKSCPDYDYLDSVMSMRSTRIHSSRSFHSASIVLASDEEADLCAALGGATIGAGATMKRWRVEDLPDVGGDLDRLWLEDVAPVPNPGFGEVRVRVSHAAVNPIDWKLLDPKGSVSAFRQNAPYTPGFDFAGVVECAGDGTDLDVGERVIGYLGLCELSSLGSAPGSTGGSSGALAEYLCVPECRVAVIPGHSDPQELAGLPLAGLTAYQGLFTGHGGRAHKDGGPLGDLKAGQTVLILGGSTAVGSIAVQLGKAAGARVVATASSSPAGILGSKFFATKLDWVRSLGADQVVDYTAEGWTGKLGENEFDMVLDCVGEDEELGWAARVLKPGGCFVSVGVKDPEVPQGADFRFARFIVAASGRDLGDLVTLTEQGKITVPVDSTHDFGELRAALERSRSGRAVGKIIVTVDESAMEEAAV